MQAHTNANGNDQNRHKHNSAIGMPERRMRTHGYATKSTDNATYADQVNTTTTNRMADTKARQFWDPLSLMEMISRNTSEYAKIQPLE